MEKSEIQYLDTLQHVQPSSKKGKGNAPCVIQCITFRATFTSHKLLINIHYIWLIITFYLLHLLHTTHALLLIILAFKIVYIFDWLTYRSKIKPTSRWTENLTFNIDRGKNYILSEHRNWHSYRPQFFCRWSRERNVI